MADAPDTTTTTTDQGTDAGNDTPGAASQAGTEGEAKVFTQEEVNRIVQERLERDRRANNIDELRAAAEELERIKESQKSEDEKAWEALAELVTQRDNALAAARDIAIRSAVETAAAKAGAINPAQVFQLINRDDVTLDDAGNVTGAEEAVTAFLDANPHFVGQANGGASSTPGTVNGGASTPPPSSDIHAQIADAEAKGDTATAIRLKAQLLTNAKAS